MRADDLPMSRKPPLGSEVELELRDLNPQGRGSSPNEGLNPPQYAPTGTVVAVKTNLAIFIIAQLTVVTFMSSFSTGLITVAIPTMARDLSIPLQTYYWPLSVYGLTAGSLLLPVGAVAGVLGSRPIYLTGVFLLAVFIMASGLAENDIQLIMFRGMQGIAVALTLPTSVGIITNSIVPGRVRNIGFACTGLGMPLGFSAGSVLGGVFVATTSWRLGWYLCAGIIFAFFLVGIWSLPLDHLSESPSAHRLRTEIDWIGAFIASTGLATLAYALVEISSNPLYIHHPSVIAALIIGLLLVPAFVLWMHRQVSRSAPALIPNSLWKRIPFTTVCLMVLLSYACMQTMELYCSLFFQNIQHASALRASLQLLPSMVLGAVLNLTAGLLVDRVPVIWITLISSVLCAGGPLLMALINPKWPYWYMAFPAQLLEPLSADVLFTVGLITVSEVFPENEQALAGAVFNTAGQLGTSVGLALMGVVSGVVTQGSENIDKSGVAALELGYRAGFWTAFGLMLVTCILCVGGLKDMGRIGLKRE